MGCSGAVHAAEGRNRCGHTDGQVGPARTDPDGADGESVVEQFDVRRSAARQRVAEAMGRSIASPEEAREIIGLPQRQLAQSEIALRIWRIFVASICV